MRIDDLLDNVGSAKALLDKARADIGTRIAWYPYDILANIWHLDALLNGEHRDLGALASGLPIADIGGADGDLAFTLEHLWGWQVDLIDTAATNANGLQGARALRDHLGSTVLVEDINLDRHFRLPRERYGLVFFLGLLYHLQNPFAAMHELALRADYCLISTRVARYAGSPSRPIGDIPVGYLVAPQETNNDATNYWIFSPAGVERLVSRTGWSVLETLSVGDVQESDPSSAEHDERMFLLLQSQAVRGTRQPHATRSQPAIADETAPASPNCTD